MKPIRETIENQEAIWEILEQQITARLLQHQSSSPQDPNSSSITHHSSLITHHSSLITPLTLDEIHQIILDLKRIQDARHANYRLLARVEKEDPKPDSDFDTSWIPDAIQLLNESDGEDEPIELIQYETGEIEIKAPTPTPPPTSPPWSPQPPFPHNPQAPQTSPPYSNNDPLFPSPSPEVPQSPGPWSEDLPNPESEGAQTPRSWSEHPPPLPPIK